MYVLIVALALVSCFVGLAMEVTLSNIGHLQNGRPPNASAALLPNIPLVPLTYVLVAWALNHLGPELGIRVVVVYALASIGIRSYLLFRVRAKFRKLNASSSASAA